jgi:hypothetical protein
MDTVLAGVRFEHVFAAGGVATRLSDEDFCVVVED